MAVNFASYDVCNLVLFMLIISVIWVVEVGTPLSLLVLEYNEMQYPVLALSYGIRALSSYELYLLHLNVHAL